MPWKPRYDRWRHGGWYVTNITHVSGAAGCVSNNYPDKKWRIACGDDKRTFANRNEAAYAEQADVLAEYLNLIAKRCDEYAVALADVGASHQLNGLRDFALQAIGD